MKRILLTLLLLLTVQGAALAQEAPPASLSVTGRGSAAGAPDLALLRLGVETSDEDVLAAFTQVNEATARIIDALLALGIERKDIQTGGLSLYQERPYDPYSDIETGLRFYIARNTLSVTVRDIALVGRALDASVQAGANNIEELSFGISDAEALEALARERAYADARRRAEHLAALSDLQLGRVFWIEANFVETRPRTAMRAYAVMEDAAGGAATVEGGQLTVNVELRASWGLES